MRAVVALEGGGAIGFSPWPADEAAVAAIRDWGASSLVTLLEPDELDGQAARIGTAARTLGLEWHHLPIPDFGVPGPGFEAGWAVAAPALLSRLRDGGRIGLHCRGGLGRSGLVAARLLVELGWEPGAAVLAVRAARPGAIETAGQLEHALGFRAG